MCSQLPRVEATPGDSASSRRTSSSAVSRSTWIPVRTNSDVAWRRQRSRGHVLELVPRQLDVAAVERDDRARERADRRRLGLLAQRGGDRGRGVRLARGDQLADLRDQGVGERAGAAQCLDDRVVARCRVPSPGRRAVHTAPSVPDGDSEPAHSRRGVAVGESARDARHVPPRQSRRWSPAGDVHRTGPHRFGAGDRDRTGMASLEGWGSTIELHPRAPPRCAGSCARPLECHARRGA